MVRAYVTVTTVTETSPDIVVELRELEGVKKADIVAGRFDIIVEVEADSHQDLLVLITEKIQAISGVGRTNTCIVLE